LGQRKKNSQSRTENDAMKPQSNLPPTAIIAEKGEPAVHDLPKTIPAFSGENDSASSNPDPNGVGSPVPKTRPSRTDPAVHQFLGMWFGCGFGIALSAYLCLHFIEPTYPYGAWLLLIASAVVLVVVAVGITDGAIKPYYVENLIIGRWKLEIRDKPRELFLQFYPNGFVLIEKHGFDNDSSGQGPANQKPAIVAPDVEEVFLGCSFELTHAVYSCPDDCTMVITVETTGQRYTERIISVKTGCAGELVMTIENIPRKFQPVCGSEQSICSLVVSTITRHITRSPE
jgi:hypothetical protein